MKKLLLLGGSAQQITAIETAKRLGYYTVLCDYLEDNPGQFYSDKFYLVSTTDMQAVLDVAVKEKVDGVLAYASDPAAPTAAFVAEKLCLPGNPYKSVDVLCCKDKFRKFLAENGFCTPKAKGYNDVIKAAADIQNGEYKLPVIVKPVDSSGSKGVGKIDGIREAEEKLTFAMSRSRCGRIIVEEYVKKSGYQIAGDGLSIDGKLVFRCFGNDHFDGKGINPFVPISASFPLDMPSWVQDKVHAEIQRLITLLGLKNSTYNFDIRVDNEYNVYLMEIAPRDGGNYIPDIIRYKTGIDLVEYSVKLAMGEKVTIPTATDENGFYSYYAVHSNREGALKALIISDEVLANNVVENFVKSNMGDRISAFTGSNTALGCMIMKFDRKEQMLDMMDNAEKWISVEVE